MSKLYRLIPLFFFCSPAFGSWSIAVGHLVAENGVASGISASITVTQGDPIILIAGNGTSTGTITSISLTGGSCTVAFSNLAHVANGTTNFADIWTAANCSASISTIAVNFTGGGTYYWTAVSPNGLGLQTLATDGSLGTSSGASSGTSPTGPSVTTTVSGDFIVSIYSPDHSVQGVNAAWTMELNTVGMAYLTSNSATAGTYAPTWSLNTSGGWAAATQAFKFASIIAPAFPMVIKDRDKPSQRHIPFRYNRATLQVVKS